jgi:hypothetical protein
MKNIHLLPTDKPSRLYKHNELGFKLLAPMPHEIGQYNGSNQNIYITNDEEIKEGDWFLENSTKLLKWKMTYSFPSEMNDICKKIILTTDQDLIKDGVQAIDDNFLEWFVKNPSCEEVEVEIDYSKSVINYSYKIIISKDEPKQETLEEAAEKYENKDQHKRSKLDFIEGAKWQQARMYSEEDLREAYFSAIKSTGEGWNGEYTGGNNPNIEEVFGVEFENWFKHKNK